MLPKIALGSCASLASDRAEWDSLDSSGSRLVKTFIKRSTHRLSEAFPIQLLTGVPGPLIQNSPMKDLPSPPRRRFRRSWYVVGGFFLSIYVLGFLGFREHARAAVPPAGSHLARHGLPDGTALHPRIGGVPGLVPWKLEVARFLAPVAAAVALIQALISSFSFHLSRIWLRIRGGHVIVAGLGEKGAILVRELLRRGRRVVVIESIRAMPASENAASSVPSSSRGGPMIPWCSNAPAP